jgi:hypothetical protein
MSVAAGLVLLLLAGLLALPGCGGRPTEPMTTTGPLFNRLPKAKEVAKPRTKTTK